MRRGRKSAAQTPALKSERIYGSKKNPKGSASSEKSAKQITLSEKTMKALQNKLAEFKKSHTNKNITLNDLKAVYRRGSGAFSSSHRPNIPRNAWAMARVNKFLKKASGQKVKAAYVQDDDLMKYEDGGELNIFYHGGKDLKGKEINLPIFLTPKKSIADWYASERGGWISEFYLDFKKPLETQPFDPITKKGGFKNSDWKLILEDIGVDIDALMENPEDVIYKLNKKDYGGNFLDIIYYKPFVEAAKKRGYDVIIEQDAANQETTGMVYLPLDEKNIHFVKSYKEFKDGGTINIKVYRGTGERVNETYGGRTDEGLGVFYTDNETMAKWFAGLIEYDVDTERYEPTGEKGKIESSTIELKNPYIIDSTHEDYDIDNEHTSWNILMEEMDAKDKKEVESFVRKLVSEGYDGIVLKDNTTNYYEDGTYDIYVKFTPEQKSNSNIFDDGGNIFKVKIYRGDSSYNNETDKNTSMWFCRVYKMNEDYVDGILSEDDDLEGSDIGSFSSREKAKDFLFKYSKELNVILLDDNGIGKKIFVSNNAIKFDDGGFIEDKMELYHGGNLAPNGKPSNLTAEQYKLVRTPEFKKWFGDWENNPESASKVVDENGEPMVVYHGTRNRFDVFDIDKSGESNTLAKVGFWFTPLSKFAYNFADSSWWGKDNAFVYSVFLLIKNPKIYESSPDKDVVYSVVENGKIYRDSLTMTQAKKIAKELNDERWLSSPHDDNDEYEVYTVSSNYERYSDSYEKFKTDIYKIAGQTEEDANIGGLGMSLNNQKETLQKYRELLKSQNYDGILIRKTRFDRTEAGGLNDQYVALYPNQIKLANGINTTFDGSNPNIRYSDGGQITNENAEIGKEYDESDVYMYIEKLHTREEDFYEGNIGERIEKFEKYIVANIPIEKINMDEYQIDEDVVKDYEKEYKKVKSYPPIVLGYYDKKFNSYDIIDGTHRGNALKNLGLKEIVCFVGINKKQKKVYKDGGDIKGSSYWHGGDLNNYDEIIAQKSGRYEYGAGLYLTTELSVALKYAKGSRKLYLIEVEKGNEITDSTLPIKEVEEFIDTYVIKSKRSEVKDRLNKFTDNDLVKANIFNNIILNEKAIKSTNTYHLRDFYVKNNIDYEIVDNAYGWGEEMLVLYNMKKIKNKKIVKHSDAYNIDLKNIDNKYAKGGKTKGIKARGDCYYIAGQFAMDNIFTPKKIEYIGTPYLVHGEVQGQGAVSHIRYGHAWIEDDENVYDFSNGRELVIPKVVYYAIGDINPDEPTKYKKYTFAEARRKMVDTGHYGCWDLDVEYREGGEVYAESMNKYDKGGKIPNDLRELPYYKGAYKGAELYSMGDDKEYQKLADRWYDLMQKHQGGKKLNQKEFEEFKKLSSDLYQSDEYAKGGLVAPNGKKSNLTPQQYKLVRTPEFKAWFGDWENNPESASKVVDENGEPLVVWHYSKRLQYELDKFYVFNVDRQIGSHFGTIKQAQNLKYIPSGQSEVKTSNKELSDFRYYQVFLNIKNPIRLKDVGIFNEETLTDAINDIQQLKDYDWEYINNYTRKSKDSLLDRVKHIAKGKGIDGAVYLNRYESDAESSYINSLDEVSDNVFKKKIPSAEDSWIAFYPEQIKLADGTNTSFLNQADIRYSKGGKVWNDEELLKRYKRGESIGFSGIAHLKAQGLIKRADGTKRKSMANGGEFDVVYRGELQPNSKNEIWVTGDEFYAKDYGETKKYHIPKNLEILDTDLNYSTFEELVDEFGYGGDYDEYKFEPSKEFIEFLKEKGYDGFQHETGGENILLFDKTKLIETAKYGAEVLTQAEKDFFDIYDIHTIQKLQKTSFKNGGETENLKIILVPETYQKMKTDLVALKGNGNPRIAMLDDNHNIMGGVFINEDEYECNFDIRLKDEHRHKGYNCLLIKALIKDFHENMDTEMLVCENDFTQKLGWENGCFTRTNAKDFMRENKYKYINYLHTDSPKIMDEFNASNQDENQDITCVNCGWKWNTSQSDESDKYVCHQKGCGFDNTLFYDTNIMNRLKKPMSVPEISTKHNADEEYVLEQLQKGMKHEMEHTDDEQIAEIIALHHIGERPDYYEVLETMKLAKGGDVDVEVEQEIMEYDIPEYIQSEKEFAKQVMNSDETRISRAMICKAKIDNALHNEMQVETPEEKNAWAEVNDIWKKCFYEIMSEDVHEHEQQQCGCGCQTTTYKKGGECGCDDTPTYNKGGLAYGNSHDKGGMPLKVESTGQDIEIEGGEGVINKRSMQMSKKLEFEGKEMTPCEVISKINEMGGGVKFKCADVKKIIAEDGNFD